MKKFVFYLVLIFTAGIVFGQANVPAIVVSGFSARGQAISSADAESITELFIAELAKQGGVRVVDRSVINQVVREMRFQTSDWSDPNKRARFGEALNAEFIVRGQISQLGPQITIAITAMDIATFEVVSSSTNQFDINTIYDTNARDRYGYRSDIFIKMPDMARNITSPIKTKMAEIAKAREREQAESEKRRQEQERLQEQSRYSLVGTWIIGSDFTRNEIPRIDSDIKENRINQVRNGRRSSSSRYLLIFRENGTMEYYDESYNSSSFNQTHERGTYTRRGNQVEYSLSGTTSRVSGSDWSGWNDAYRKFDTTTSNSSTSYTINIEFRGGGNTLIWGWMEYRRL
jgi:TolB-like protein